MLPSKVGKPLQQHLDKVAVQHRQDLSRGEGWVELALAFAKKSPNAARD